MTSTVIQQVGPKYVLVYAASRKRYYILDRASLGFNPYVGHTVQINLPKEGGPSCITDTGKKTVWFSRSTSSRFGMFASLIVRCADRVNPATDHKIHIKRHHSHRHPFMIAAIFALLHRTRH